MKYQGTPIRGLFTLFFMICLPVIAVTPAAEAQTSTGDQIEGGSFKYIPLEEGLNPYPDAGQTIGRDGYMEISAQFTGTGDPEPIEYYVPVGAPPPDGYPLMVCWHGYGQSCLSVSFDSMIDEECAERRWVFLSITGVNQVNFGYLQAQIHCTKAIDFLINQLMVPVDTNRIYMAGFSMGGAGAASYTCRHLSQDDGYRVAGLIIVSAACDWIDAYYRGDLGVVTYLPTYLGGPPSYVPFKWQQISTIYLENDTVVLEKSMGQNLAHNIPVFITYAENDPLEYVPIHCEYLIQRLGSLGANILVDYYVYHDPPHSWELLDVDAAFDFLEAYSLKDQETDDVGVLVDRSAKFYWADITVDVPDEFAKLAGTVDSILNKLTLTETTNMLDIGIDCDWTGLNNSQSLYIDFQTDATQDQQLELSPLATEPTYTVDETTGFLYDYTYSVVEHALAIDFEAPIDQEIKASYEQYDLTLTTDGVVALRDNVNINMQGGDPFDIFMLFLSLQQKETKVGIRHLLVYPLFPTIKILWNLDSEGKRFMSPVVPGDPGLVDVIIYTQFLTYDTSIKAISNLQSTLIIE